VAWAHGIAAGHALSRAREFFFFPERWAREFSSLQIVVELRDFIGLYLYFDLGKSRLSSPSIVSSPCSTIELRISNRTSCTHILQICCSKVSATAMERCVWSTDLLQSLRRPLTSSLRRSRHRPWNGGSACSFVTTIWRPVMAMSCVVAFPPKQFFRDLDSWSGGERERRWERWEKQKKNYSSPTV